MKISEATGWFNVIDAPLLLPLHDIQTTKRKQGFVSVTAGGK